MKHKETSNTRRRSPPPLLRDEQPLLRILVAEATRRGDTLAELAKALGVTYERLAQWRRNDAAIGNAHRAVHEKAGNYLGIPAMAVLILAGTVGLKELVWPARGSLNDRVDRELERLQHDPFVGPFVPPDLASAAPAVKLFVLFLARELEGDASHGKAGYRWMMALHQATTGNASGLLELEAMRKDATNRAGIF